MSEEDSPSPQNDAPLEDWRQGDFALDVGGFLFASASEGSDKFDATEETKGVVGFVAISQTCDIVRDTGGRHFVTVCPLIKLDSNEVKAARKGLRPYLTDIEGAGSNKFADLRRIMSVSKSVVRAWERRDGFSNEAGRIRFAAALERKFGQFAFPNEFDEAISTLKKRIWQRHDSADSPVGQVYRSIEQIRFRAAPSWEADIREISVIAILKPKDDWETTRAKIGEELTSALEKVEWSDGYKWAEQKFMLASPNDLTAADIIESQRGDFDFLCY